MLAAYFVKHLSSDYYPKYMFLLWLLTLLQSLVLQLQYNALTHYLSMLPLTVAAAHGSLNRKRYDSKATEKGMYIDSHFAHSIQKATVLAVNL